MPDLFDLPFEEEDSRPSTVDSDRHRSRSTVAPPSSHGHRAHRRASAISSRSGSSEVWVEGELSNCKTWNTGHLYFTLKDAATQIRGVIFRSALRYLKFKPADGLRVVARGRVSVYEPKGEYQLVCEHLEPQGLGALQLAFDQLKKRLQQEGLFDAARKRPLPALPRKIGIVTSLDGAAIRDIIKVLRRRYRNAAPGHQPGARAGRGARRSKSRAACGSSAASPASTSSSSARGGGSIEDLWAFNEEIVARAIARVARAGDFGGRTRNRRHDCRLRRRRPRADAVGRRRDRRRGARTSSAAASIGCDERLRAAVRGRVQRLSRRVHVAERAAGVRGTARPRRDARRATR